MLEMHHGVPIYGSMPDRVAPNFNAAGPDDTVVIEAGESVSVGGSHELLDVLVRGHLTIEPGAEIRCRTFTVAGAGALCDGHDFTLVIRDLPIDTEMDPQQWGHGVLCLDGGRIEWESPNWRTTHKTLLHGAAAGHDSVAFDSIVTDWQVGDELVFPDTRQPDSESDLGQQTEIRTISTFTGGIVVLSEPLEFDHLGYGELAPDVGNLTQPTVIRSENPNGVRGHIACIGSGQMFFNGVLSLDMGRTRAVDEIDNSRKLEDGTWYIGTNQIARYALFHQHHCFGKYGEEREWQGACVNSVCRNSPKWAVSIHQSHWMLVEGNLAYNCAGCGIVTEEELSYAFAIRNNMVVASQPGSGLRITSDHGGRGHRNDPTGDFWHNRGGLGLSSVMGEVTGNRLYCCTEPIGMAGAFGGGIVLYNPIERGVPLLSKADANSRLLSSHMGYVDGEPKRYPFGDTSGNIVWSGLHGIETWNGDSYEDFGDDDFFPDLTLIHCKRPVLIFDHQETVFDRWKIYGDASKLNSGTPQLIAIDFKDNYRFGITSNDCDIRGYDAAYRYFNDSLYTQFRRCNIDCPVAVYFPEGPNTRLGGDEPRLLLFEDCTFGEDTVFAVHRELPKYGPRVFDKVSQTLVKPWKDGYEYQMFHPIQIDRVAFGEQAPASVIQRADFGFMWADDQTDCCAKVKILEARIKELEAR